MITKFTIFGERGSGTNFIESAIKQNFNLKLVWDHGWKHFFGFSPYKNSDDTLFIGIVRDPHKWINSLNKLKWHLQPEIENGGVNELLNCKFWSYNNGMFHHMLPKVKYCTKGMGEEILEDRNIITGERYQNIFECRKIKCQYLLKTMPTKVKNYILIKYEDLRDDYESVLNRIKDTFNLIPRNNFPITIDTCKGFSAKYIPNQKYQIKEEQVWNHPDLDISLEHELGYCVPQI